jgi:hypothetical protein
LESIASWAFLSEKDQCQPGVQPHSSMAGIAVIFWAYTFILPNQLEYFFAIFFFSSTRSMSTW